VLELGGGKQRAVLAALLLHRDEIMPVERLVDEVWGDDPPASAAHSLESYVSRLRRALSPYGVAIERRGGAATGSTSVGRFSTPRSSRRS
jgi:DNA-binding SARP family transcriptional activator